MAATKKEVTKTPEEIETESQELEDRIGDLENDLADEKTKNNANKETIAFNIEEIKRLKKERDELAASAQDLQEEEGPEEEKSNFGLIAAIVIGLVIAVFGFFKFTDPTPKKATSNPSPAPGVADKTIF